MKILVLGAGNVGTGVAEYIAENGGEVSIIEKDPQTASLVRKLPNINVIVGDALNIEILKEAEADSFSYIISAMSNDEQNIVACKLIGSLFNVKTKIARIKSTPFLHKDIFKIFLKENFDIDIIVQPEIEIANAICDISEVYGAYDVIKTNNFIAIKLICLPETEILNTTFSHFRSITELDLYILTITRNGKTFFPTGKDLLLPGDEIYIITTKAHLNEAMKLFGYNQTKNKDLLIIGGSQFDISLIQTIYNRNQDITISIVEESAENAQRIAEIFSNTIVIVGNPLNTSFLEEIISNINTAVVFTADDKTNVLSSLFLKKHKVNRILTVLKSNDFDILFSEKTGYSIINSSQIIIEKMLQKSRNGEIKTVQTLKGQIGNIVEALVSDSCAQTGHPVKTLKIKDKLIPIFVIRGGITMSAQSEITLIHGDIVIMLVSKDSMELVEKIFSNYTYSKNIAIKNT